MKHFIEYPEGATPLDPDEIKGLIPGYITTQGELNLLEQENILEAQSWSSTKRKDVLNESFLRELHKRMFKNVWKWAGEYRKSDKNIGIDWEKIPEEMRKLCADASYWIEHKTESWDEIGARFHHRLVFIHPFPNGNGRHARLMTDVLMRANGQEEFTWGRASLEQEKINGKQIRDQYIAALKEADKRKIESLVKFARS